MAVFIFLSLLNLAGGQANDVRLLHLQLKLSDEVKTQLERVNSLAVLPE